jgi:hypothetical protein
MKRFALACTTLVLSGILGLQSASAGTILHLNQGSQGNAASNINYYATQNGHTVTTMNNATFNASSVAALAAYDWIILPWYVDGDANLDWATRVLPILNAGGSILWEEPANIGDLAGSGLSLTSSTAGYTSSDRSLVAPFDANGAESHYHVHFGINSASAAWNVFSTDSNGKIHGVYGEFGTNGGRMVVGVSDNLYHPLFSLAGDADHYALFVNEMNWLVTGDVSTPIGVPEPTTLVLLGIGATCLGLGARARRKQKIAA